jgi:hypothetical protein
MILLSPKPALVFLAPALAFWFGYNRRSYNQPAAVVQTFTSEKRAIDFLSREVPGWSKENGCYSCHNNGDAARALYLATKKGFVIPAEALADTTAWLSRPSGWDENKGDPGFSDKRLATLQFTSSLAFATASGRIADRTIIEQAAQKLIQAQEPDGSWKIVGDNDVGSPATYGTALATWTAYALLRDLASPAYQPSIQRAQTWLRRLSPDKIVNASVLLRIKANGMDEQYRLSLRLLETGQTRAGGWGPYVDSPPEPFDTALAMLALLDHREKPGVVEMIRRGREFLTKAQLQNGSWPATTRPPNGESYAQMISTTGWAAIALLESYALFKSSDLKRQSNARGFKPPVDVVEQIDFKRFADVVAGQIFNQRLDHHRISP